MRETMHFADVHTGFTNEKARHYSGREPFLKCVCSFCVKDCPSKERLGGVFYGE